MDNDGTEKLLPNSGSNRRNDKFRKHGTPRFIDGFKFQSLRFNRLALALVLGVFCGFVFPYFFMHNGHFSEKYYYSVMEAAETKTPIDTAETADNLAVFLHKKIRVMCIVMTTEGGLNSSAETIMDTWGKRCTKTLFFSDKVPELNLTNIVLLNETDSFAKLKEACKYVHMYHPNEFDWILKATVNAYIVLENLRHLLYQYESDWPLIIGQRTLKEDFMLGIFILSKRAFTRLLEDSFTNPDFSDVKGNDDVEVMRCLEHINVIKIDGFDRDGRGMIFKWGPERHLFPERYDDNDQRYVHKFKQGAENCCSDRLIATQNVYATDLYYMEYFIYKVHAFGLCRKPETLPERFSLEEVIK